jgi:serine/threonine protein kinase
MYHQNRMPTPIRELRPELPEGLAQVLEYMLAKDPNHRYQTPDEVAAALEPFVVEPIGPPPAAEMPRLSPAAMASPTPSAAPAAESPDDSRDSGLIHREELQKAGIRPTLTAISLPDMPPLPAMPPTWSKPGNQATPPRISPQPTPSGMSVPTVQQTPHRTPPPWAGAGPAAPQVPPPFAPFGRPPNAKPPRRRSNKVTTLIMVVVAGLIGAGIGMVVWSQKGGSPPTKVTPKK